MGHYRRAGEDGMTHVLRTSSRLAVFALTGMIALGMQKKPSAEMVAAPVAPPPSASNLWFTVGEEITYDIYWGIIKVGFSHVTTDWVKHEDGRTLLRIRFVSRSNKVLHAIYPVDDIQETLIDPETFLPVVSMMNSRQGRRYVHEITRFDHAAGIAYWESLLKDTRKEVAISPDTRDIISLMYYIRSLDYGVGEQMDMQVFTDEKVFDLQIRIPAKENIQLDSYGRVASHLFVPEAEFQGLIVRKGKAYLWVSDDERRLCTQIKVQIPVASVRIQIAEVRGPGQDFWVGKRKPGSPGTIPVPRAR